MDSVCRTCMTSEKDEEMVNIFVDSSYEPNLYKMLTVCTDLKISNTDELPKTMCTTCIHKLKSYFDFRKTASEVEKKLLNKLNYIKVEKQDVELKVEHDEDNIINKDEFNQNNEEFNQNNEEFNQNNEENNFNSDDEDLPLNLLCDIKPKIEEKTELTCPVCDKTFTKPYRLKRHSIIHDSISRPFSCNECPQRFKNELTLERHKLSHSMLFKKENKSTTKCRECSKEFQSPHSLIAHMKIHTRPKICGICKKAFGKMSHLKRHELTHPENRPFRCQNCTKTYPDQESLNDHILTRHAQVKPYSCHKCKRKFSTEKILKLHILNHDKDNSLIKSHVCPICGKCFAFNNLRQHLQRHDGVKQFSCKFCPNKFVSKGELKSHTITHTGHKPYVCDTCGTAFTKNTSLTKHKLRHLGIKRFQCDECPRKFVTNDHLKRHSRTHTGEKPYKCDQCGRAFSQTNDLIKHKRSHFGENLYKCDQCGDSFRLKTELRRHELAHFADSQRQDSPDLLHLPNAIDVEKKEDIKDLTMEQDLTLE